MVSLSLVVHRHLTRGSADRYSCHLRQVAARGRDGIVLVMRTCICLFVKELLLLDLEQHCVSVMESSKYLPHI